jgi:hypothetical protein
MKALSLDRDKRFRSARSFQVACEDLLRLLPKTSNAALLGDYVQAQPHLEPRDARQHPGEMARLAGEGHDINAGMILVTPEQTFHGAEAIVELDRIADRRRPAWLIRAIYPSLRGLRHLLLKAVGRDPRIA